MSKQTTLLAGIAGLFLAAPAFATNGYFSHGYGVKSQGIAGIGIALPQDGLAAATNPAGTALVGDRIDLGLTWFSPSRSAEISGTAFGFSDGKFSGNGKSDFFIPEFGYTKQLSPSLGAGVAVYATGGMNTTYNSGIPLFDLARGKAGVNLEQLFISPSLAWKPNEQHSIGAAVNFAYQRFAAKGLANFTNPFFSSSPNDVTDRGTDTATGWGLRLGWIGQLGPALSLGATWSSKITPGKFSKYKGLFSDGGSFEIPENFGLGLAFKASPALTLAADVQEIKYGGVKSVANPISNLNPGVSGLLGSANGAGFGWKDVTVVKLGVSYDYSKDLTLRAGFSHTDQPIPSSEVLFNILAPATIQDHLTLGGTWKTSGGGELSVTYAHGFKKELTGSIPGALGVGPGKVKLSLDENILGVAYGWKY